ncbi:HlyD family secretion protein [Cesiribacter sp. SM1]|uniref:HlyD family secretion protein n=1 Tax=Cesiribacter sp. SM1 TaxID=2861196 RepID=UPI001CD65FF7|nr:HlyD family efflux transporter periplasmic adaptor subunit [Cesiribacter sp. SM1]
MLNISKNEIDFEVAPERYASINRLENKSGKNIASRLLIIALLIFIAVLFLPWTQNVQGVGYVTTRLPSQRPQTVPAIIDGRIVQWYVREGELVHRGDTLLQLGEIKEDYLDPLLVERAELQFEAKAQSAQAYGQKADQLDNQIAALQEQRVFKLEQARNYLQQAALKVQSDSMDLVASRTQISIAENQYLRMEELFEQGLKSRTDLEARRMKLQEAQAKVLIAENKLLSSKNDLLNARIAISGLQAEFQDKLAKAASERAEALSGRYTATADAAKLQNQATNYDIRRGLYFVTAPQTGYITKTIKSGLGETVKSGEQLLTIMPSDYDLAAEIYVQPIDLPLLETGQPVRVQFDGWPSIVFSGWPNAAYGTFGAEIVAIDNVISENGKYRILVAPDPDEHDWPDAMRIGAGAQGMALLGDVPLGYELWRKINGFPPDFYQRKPVTTNPAANKEKK